MAFILAILFIKDGDDQGSYSDSPKTITSI